MQRVMTTAQPNFGIASARKAGRDPRWPYVPVILVTDDVGVTRQTQLRKLAFETRAEAVDAAERHITANKLLFAQRLADPRCRALRAHYGLPRELEVVMP
jgi:hypothetical protein